MTQFFGREGELSTLFKLKEKKTSSMVVVTGRRRIGKSRLVEEFAGRATGTRRLFLTGLAPIKGVSANDQRMEFARQLEREVGLPRIAHDDWTDLFSHLGRATSTGKWIVLLDEISWMGSSDATFLPKLKNAWDGQLKKNPKLVLILCGSVSSWIEKNILSSTGFLGRVSSRIQLGELGVSDCLEFWGKRGERTSVSDKLKVISVTGGVPRYLEEILASEDWEENIRRLCFQKEGILFNEFEQIFTDMFDRRAAAYKSIVRSLIHGGCELKEIYESLGTSKSGTIIEYLSDLELAGFVSRDYNWSLKTKKTSKKSKYRLRDNYVRFYLKYVEPNRSAIESDRFKNRSLSTLLGFDTIMGLSFENLVLCHRSFIWEKCGIDPGDIVAEGTYYQSQTQRRKGCQIDYLIQTRHGPLYLCEIKSAKEEIGTEVVGEVKNKIDRLETPKHASILPVLIHINGVKDTVLQEEFFSRIVDFTQIVNSH
ncbi:MAG: ATP-binding protein [Deltaproteobacteria bacterium]|nr:ATP-binding protein [Deltaproteobacteria bacterium]